MNVSPAAVERERVGSTAVRRHEARSIHSAIDCRPRGPEFGARLRIDPVPYPLVDATLYKFLVEFQLGIHVSLHRDVMGASFVPQEIHVKYEPSLGSQKYHDVFGCPVLFEQSDNRLVFDAAWLSRTAELGLPPPHAGHTCAACASASATRITLDPIAAAARVAACRSARALPPANSPSLPRNSPRCQSASKSDPRSASKIDPSCEGLGR